jgi:hypothetical protein
VHATACIMYASNPKQETRYFGSPTSVICISCGLVCLAFFSRSGCSPGTEVSPRDWRFVQVSTIRTLRTAACLPARDVHQIPLIALLLSLLLLLLIEPLRLVNVVQTMATRWQEDMMCVFCVLKFVYQKKKKKIVNTISGIPLDSPRQQQLQVHYQ